VSKTILITENKIKAEYFDKFAKASNALQDVMDDFRDKFKNDLKTKQIAMREQDKVKDALKSYERFIAKSDPQ